MRIHNLAQLKRMPISERFKKQIEKEFKLEPTPAPRAKAAGSLPAAGSPPQDALVARLRMAMPSEPWVVDYVGAVPGRKYELDIALVDDRLAVEVDGFAHHGRNKQNYNRDRDKDYLLSLQGWCVLRIQAGLICKSPEDAVSRVVAFLSACRPRQSLLWEAGLWPVGTSGQRRDA